MLKKPETPKMDVELSRLIALTDTKKRSTPTMQNSQDSRPKLNQKHIFDHLKRVNYMNHAGHDVQEKYREIKQKNENEINN